MVTREAMEGLKHHALSRYPEEACGVQVKGAFVPVPNIAPDPCRDFRMPPEVWLDGPIEAVLHSHTDPHAFRAKAGCHPWCPTAADMRGQSQTGVTWAIAVTDGVQVGEPFWWDESLLDTPILERPFRHGVLDCYSAIRAWYWQTRGVILRDFPRSDAWWDEGGDLYREGYPEAGFRSLQGQETVDVGDVLLARIRSPVPNHAAVYIGQGRIYHHLFGRLSRREPLARYRDKFITDYLRYDP